MPPETHSKANDGDSTELPIIERKKSNREKENLGRAKKYMSLLFTPVP